MTKVTHKFKKYVLVSGGPSMGGGSLRVVIREVGSVKLLNVTYKRYCMLRDAGMVMKPAFVPKENR